MAVNEVYRRQVALLIKTLPLVAAETAFALGTFARRVDDFVSCEPDWPEFSLALRPDVTFRSE